MLHNTIAQLLLFVQKPAPTYVTKKMRLSKFDDEDISPSIALDFVLGCPDS